VPDRLRRHGRTATLAGVAAFAVFVAVAFFVVQWHTGIAAKLPALLGASLVVSTGLAVGLSRLPYVSTVLGVKRP
jgi:hypothetical protein